MVEVNINMTAAELHDYDPDGLESAHVRAGLKYRNSPIGITFLATVARNDVIQILLHVYFHVPK